MFKTVMDVKTGMLTEVEMSVDEIAEIDARRSAAIISSVAAADEAKDVGKFDRRLRAVVLWVAQLNGKTPLQAKNEIKAILEAMP